MLQSFGFMCSLHVDTVLESHAWNKVELSLNIIEYEMPKHKTRSRGTIACFNPSIFHLPKLYKAAHHVGLFFYHHTSPQCSYLSHKVSSKAFNRITHCLDFIQNDLGFPPHQCPKQKHKLGSILFYLLHDSINLGHSTQSESGEEAWWLLKVRRRHTKPQR